MIKLLPKDIIKAYNLNITPKHNSSLYIVLRMGTTVSLEVSQDIKDLLIAYKHATTIESAANKANMSLVKAIQATKKLVRDNVISHINDDEVHDTAEHINPWLVDLGKEKFSFFISKPFIFALLFLIVFGIMGLIQNPHYLPKYQHFFFSDNVIFVYLVVNIFTIFFVTLHELAHFVVTKAVGAQARITLSNRFFFLVGETDSYYLANCTPTERIKVYVAGLLTDLSVFSIGIVYYQLSEILGHVTLLDTFVPVILAIVSINILWQLNIFLETDIYNIISELLKEDYLRESALKQIFVENRHSKFLKKMFFLLPDDVWDEDLRTLGSHDKKIINLYKLLIVFGFLTLGIMLVWLIIPREIYYVSLAFGNFYAAIAQGNMIQAMLPLLFLIVLLLHYTILVRLITHHAKVKR